MNKLHFTIYFILIAFHIHIFGQTSLSVSTNFGGAIPNKSQKNSTAKIFPGANLGLTTQITGFNKIVIKTELELGFTAYNYYLNEDKKDTLVESVVLGNTVMVPTYYYTFIKGHTRLFYIIPNIILSYKLCDKIIIYTNLYSKFNIIHKDLIFIKVQVGEGGLIPDVNLNQDNSSNINLLNAGLGLGIEYKINDNYSLFFNTKRDLWRFYILNTIKDSDGNDLPFYFTGMNIGINYKF
jgi:hypothetical protein